MILNNLKFLLSSSAAKFNFQKIKSILNTQNKSNYCSKAAANNETNKKDTKILKYMIELNEKEREQTQVSTNVSIGQKSILMYEASI